MLEFNIERADSPLVYDLGVGHNNKSLTISIHNKALKKAKEILLNPEIQLIKSFQEDLQLEFVKPGENFIGWGFGLILSELPSKKDGYSLLECQLPVVGETRVLRESPDWNLGYGTSATLNVLFHALGVIGDVDIADRGEHQLVDVNLVTQRGMHGGSLSVILGRSLVPWLSRQPDDSSNQEIEKIMRGAYEYMWRPASFGASYFQTEFRQPKWVNLGVPGDACGLDPENYYDDPGVGYELLPHNVDGPIQQLTLLMGIAAICESARKSGF